MKILFIIYAMLVVMSANAQWVQVGTASGQYIVSFTANNNNVFAGTWYNGSSDGRLLRSTNNGENWTYLGGNTPHRSLTISNNNLIAGTDLYGILISTNNGLNWVSGYQLNGGHIWSLSSNGNKIYAGTDDGVFLSTNYGLNWSQTNLRSKIILSIALNGNNVFAGTKDSGIYITSNGGVNWTHTSLNNREILSLVFLNSYIFAGTPQYGIYLSTNDGINWSQTTLNSQYINSLAVIGNNIFAGSGNDGVFLSTNNGITWTSMNQGFNNSSILTLYINNNYLIAGTYLGAIWRRPLSDMIGIQNISTETPSKFSLSQNFPNPFNPSTKIIFTVVSSTRVSGGDLVQLKVYDIMGKEVQTLVNERLQPGTYEAAFDGSALNSGVYFYKLTTDGYTETKKMLLIK